MILKSATKIVLILMVLALIGLTFIGRVEGKDFVIIISIIINFYYNNKKNKSIKEEQESISKISSNLDV